MSEQEEVVQKFGIENTKVIVGLALRFANQGVEISQEEDGFQGSDMFKFMDEAAALATNADAFTKLKSELTELSVEEGIELGKHVAGEVSNILKEAIDDEVKEALVQRVTTKAVNWVIASVELSFTIKELHDFRKASE